MKKDPSHFELKSVIVSGQKNKSKKCLEKVRRREPKMIPKWSPKATKIAPKSSLEKRSKKVTKKV